MSLPRRLLCAAALVVALVIAAAVRAGPAGTWTEGPLPHEATAAGYTAILGAGPPNMTMPAVPKSGHGIGASGLGVLLAADGLSCGCKANQGCCPSHGCCPTSHPHTCANGDLCYVTEDRARAECGDAYEFCGISQ